MASPLPSVPVATVLAAWQRYRTASQRQATLAWSPGQPDARRGLAAFRRALQKLPAQAGPVQLRWEEGTEAIEACEVLVLVLGQHGGLVSRKTVRGRPINLRELGLRLAGAEVAVEGIGRRPQVKSPPLSPAEASLLDKVGFVESDGDSAGAFEKSDVLEDKSIARRAS